VLALCGSAFNIRAGAPGFAWSYPNAGGPVFAVDTQTNVYVNRGGTVVVFNNSGVPTRTNAICPVPGVAQRDAAGDYYFAGTFTPPLDFGGVTLSTNRCFLAKYNSLGALLWASGFVGTNILYQLSVGDLQVEPGGVAYTSIAWSEGGHPDGTFSYESYVLRFDATGVNTWMDATGDDSNGYEVPSSGAVLGAVSVTNCYAVMSLFPPGEAPLAPIATLQVFPKGVQDTVSTWYAISPLTGAHTVADSTGNIFNIETTSYEGSPGAYPTKRNGAGALLWRAAALGDKTMQTFAGDLWGGFHAAGVGGDLGRFDSAGNLVWTLNLSSPCDAMVIDSRGNRFITVNNGGLYALEAEPFTAPVITNAPQGVTVMGGTTVDLGVGVSGGTPLSYQWLEGGSPIVGETNSTLTLADATSAQSGLYSVIVTNVIGSVTSFPVAVRIKNVELFAGTQLLTNGTYYFATNPVITVDSLFANGSAFYTLDGSTPSYLSTPYTGPVTITSNVTMNAIGYSANFSQSELADAVTIVLPGEYNLTAYSLGGGTITLSPPGGSAVSNSIACLSNSIVTATASAASGWSFLYWLGAASGTNPSVNVTMDQNSSLQAVFGTGLSTTVAGNGQIIVSPPAGPYPYGSVARLEGLPGPGSYFGAWGNAATGDANPLYFTVTNANPVISSIFGTVSVGQAALTVLITGQGTVGVNPAGNVFSTSQSVTITATPSAGQTFLGWSGGASGTQNPLNVTLNQSTVITAEFSGQIARLTASPGYTSGGFTFTLTSDPGSVFQILVSTNLSSWQTLGSVTNTTGLVQFTDTATTGSQARFYRAEQ